MELLRTPKENIAEDEVSLIQEAQTQIKEIIMADLLAGISRKETNKKVNDIIDKAVKETTLDKKTVEKSLQTLAVNNYYLTQRSVNNLKVNFIKEMRKTVPSNVISLDGFNLTKEQEKFRPYIDKSPKGLAVIEDYQSKVRAEMRVLASQPAKANVVGKDGRVVNYSLRNYAEMKVRYEANKQDLERLKGEAVDLVWTSSHADSSIRCQKWQGRLYSIKGNRGTIDGEPYTPLDEALAGEDGDGNGIINGYNCRHRLIEYQPKMKPPVDYSEREIKQQRAIDQRQRRYENDIRNMKIQERISRSSGDTEYAKELRQRWRELTDDYKAYSLNKGRAFYEWRTRV